MIVVGRGRSWWVSRFDRRNVVRDALSLLVFVVALKALSVAESRIGYWPANFRY